MRVRAAAWAAGIALLAVASGNIGGASASDRPGRVTFASGGGRTTLLGYVFKAARMSAARVPAVVMMHGRAGAYSSAANGVYDASTLSQRHAMWGVLLAEAGYVAVLVDGFGPRGYPKGFPRFSYATR